MASAHVARARGMRSARTLKQTSAARQSISRPLPGEPKATLRVRRRDPLSGQLELIALQLGVLYSTCVTVERTLRGRDAEQDAEIACCLMHNVTGPLHDQAEALQALVRELETRDDAAVLATRRLLR